MAKRDNFLDRDRVGKILNKLKEPTKNSNIELAICLVKKVNGHHFTKSHRAWCN